MKSAGGAATAEFCNHILRALPAADLARLQPLLTPVNLPAKSVLLQADQPITVVHFVEAGVVSLIINMEDGARIEVGLVGLEGMVGLNVLLGVPVFPFEALVQVAGRTMRLAAADLRTLLVEMPSLQAALLRYADAFQVQTAQLVACNGRHDIVQRLARWLLMTHDRVEGDSFLMTQEFMSNLLGVRRPGVTVAVGSLQRAGIVEHRQRTLTVLDRRKLEAASCECYAVMRRRFTRLHEAEPVRS